MPILCAPASYLPVQEDMTQAAIHTHMAWKQRSIKKKKKDNLQGEAFDQ